jgi:hypothetical protein
MAKFVSAIFFLMVAGGAYLVYIGVFYPTGRQYYEVCWEKKNANEKSHASDAYQDVIWTNCDNIAARVIFALGMLAQDAIRAVWNREGARDGEQRALQDVCPELGSVPAHRHDPPQRSRLFRRPAQYTAACFVRRRNARLVRRWT